MTDPKRPFHVDKEYVLTVSDLYHQEAPPLINYYQSADNYNNNQGAEPVPDSVLINEAQGGQFSIVPGKTYLFRIISMAAMMPFWVQFDQHNMTIVEVDGVYVTPVNVDRIFIAAAQRYSVLVTAKADKSSNFAIVAQMNQYMLVYPWLYPQDFNPAVRSRLMAWCTCLMHYRQLLISSTTPHCLCQIRSLSTLVSCGTILNSSLLTTCLFFLELQTSRKS